MENTLDETDRAKIQTNERQKRFYLKNKERINRNKQIARDALLKTVKQPILLPETIIFPEPEVPNKPTVYTEKLVLDMINALSINENTKKKKISNMKILFDAYPTNNLKNSINDYNRMKPFIETLKTTRNPDQTYSLGSIKSFVETILWVVSTLNIPIRQSVFRQYEMWQGILKEQVMEKHEEDKKNPDNAVLTYPDYMKKILDLFGVDSKPYLIASLYNEVLCRDDLGALNIVSRKADVKPKINYIIVKKRGNSIVILQDFKTAEKYISITEIITPKLTDLVKKYIVKNNITDKLFPEAYVNGLTKYITNMNKQVGLKQGVNGIRKCIVSDFLNNDKGHTVEERALFASRLGHSLETQPYYQYVQK